MTLKLEAKIRTITGKKLAAWRQADKIPAVLYGHGVANKNLELDYNTFEKIFNEAGESTLIDLAVDGQPTKVIVADVQYDEVSGRYRHIDFHQIKMDEKVNATVELKFSGEPKAVKDLGGIFVSNVSELEIRCFPNDLIGEIEVDISGLSTFDDVITISDLKLSDKVEILGHELDDVVATVTAPKAEVEEAPVVAAETAEGEAKAEGESKAVEEGEAGK